jgi:vancomycin resistance protein YoaR
MPRLRIVVLTALGGVAIVVAAATAAWAVDTTNHRGRVARNVTLAGHPVGGMDRAQVGAVVAALAARYPSATVRVRAPGADFTAPASSFGLQVRATDTVDAALATGRTGALPARVIRWVKGFVTRPKTPVKVDVGRTATTAIVAQLDKGKRAPAKEPSLAVKAGHIVAVAGEDGHGIDPSAVVDGIRAAASHGPSAISAHVDRGTIHPRFSIADAQRVARQAEVETDTGLEVRAGSVTATATPATLKGWVQTIPAEEGLRLGVDPAATIAGLRRLLPSAGTPAVDAGFVVSGGAVQITPSRTGTGCCGPQGVDLIEAALTKRPSSPVTLPLDVVQPRRTVEQARKLGIVEAASTFTTPHHAGEPRVANIHRIADILRGAVIEPGQTFSVNQYVGPRTAAKGFVDAPVIGEHNTFSHDIGGGISQMGTTFFNAAFFDGLQILEYQAHTEYISRYPYGRESTLNFPHPDLVIKNNSPHGILVWPTYTGTSLTVTLYSTKWVEASQTGQTSSPRGPCTYVKTERTRRFLSDGHTSVDYFFALYSPAEGVDCPR